MIALLATLAFAQDPPVPFDWRVPDVPAPVAQECEPVDLVVGAPLPAMLLDADGLVSCYATVVPTSILGGYLLSEAWAEQAAPRGQKLALEADWYEERIKRYQSAIDKPIPWMQRPVTQRWAGRLETIVAFVAVGAVYVALERASNLGE